MGRLRYIDIFKVHPIKTDDFSEDEVYYMSFVNCGDDGGSGQHPGSQVPLLSKTLTHGTKPLEFEEGKETSPFTSWGRLFPTHPDHENCCVEGQLVVSGPVFFFDKEPDEGDKFWEVFGIIVIALISLGVIVAVTSALAPNPALALAVGAGAGVATGAALAKAWERFLNFVGNDNYLGGVRISFPCESSQRTIIETHDLQGASNGVQSERLVRGRSAARWDKSSAQYKITFRATYNT